MVANSLYDFNPRYPMPTAEVQQKLLLSLQEASRVATRTMRCPVCGFRVAEIPVTQSTVVFVKCQKCKFQGPLSPAYFRRLKRSRSGAAAPYVRRIKR